MDTARSLACICGIICPFLVIIAHPWVLSHVYCKWHDTKSTNTELGQTALPAWQEGSGHTRFVKPLCVCVCVCVCVCPCSSCCSLLLLLFVGLQLRAFTPPHPPFGGLGPQQTVVSSGGPAYSMGPGGVLQVRTENSSWTRGKMGML